MLISMFEKLKSFIINLWKRGPRHVWTTKKGVQNDFDESQASLIFFWWFYSFAFVMSLQCEDVIKVYSSIFKRNDKQWNRDR